MAALALLVAARAEGGSLPAAGGAPLLRGAEGAARTVVGVVEEPARVDTHGYSAWLRVERDLAAPADAVSHPESGSERIHIAWEELSSDRPVRFAQGSRIAVALAPMPGYSLWLQRFPKADVLAVAEAGAAFLRDPDPATLEGLARYVQIPAAEREESPGVDALSALVATGAVPLAEAASERLDKIGGLESKLREPAAGQLTHAMGSASRPDALRLAVVRLAGAHQLSRLRPALEALAQGVPPLAGPAWSAIVEIDGDLPYATAKQLVASTDPAVRAVGVRFLVGTPDAAEVSRRARSDPAPEVRSAAVHALLAANGSEALEVGYAALFDPAPSVRADVAQAVGAFGSQVVPRLRELAETHTGREAGGPMAALAYAGPEGQEVLMELSRSHPDEPTRRLALFFLGKDPRAALTQ